MRLWRFPAMGHEQKSAKTFDSYLALDMINWTTLLNYGITELIKKNKEETSRRRVWLDEKLPQLPAFAETMILNLQLLKIVVVLEQRWRNKALNNFKCRQVTKWRLNGALLNCFLGVHPNVMTLKCSCGIFVKQLQVYLAREAVASEKKYQFVDPVYILAERTWCRLRCCIADHLPGLTKLNCKRSTRNTRCHILRLG